MLKYKTGAIILYTSYTQSVCVLTHPGRHGIASADGVWYGLASFPGHPGNEDSHGRALWIINAPHTHTDTLMSQVGTKHCIPFSAIMYVTLSLQRALLCVHDCQTGSEATNHDTMSAHKYMHECASLMSLSQ